MQVQLPTRAISDSARLSTATFHVPASAMAKLASTFISGLYSDPVRFVFELPPNGVDAAGCPSKVEVRLPTRLEPAYVCEDGGPGMSREFMFSGYCEIMTSTKDQDATKIGGWGVGRLSALAICDSYLVETQHQSYLVRKDTGGVPEIAHVGPSQVSGTRVTVPVPPDKVAAVREAGLKALRWYSPAVTCNLKVEVPELVLGSRDLGWAFTTEKGDPVVVMAGYEYPLELGKVFGYHDAHKWRGLVIFAGPDFAEVVTNRQSLNYGDRTKANLKERLEKVKTDLAAVFEAEIAQVATIFQAKRKLREANRGLPVTLKDVRYRGQPLSPYLDVGRVKIVQTKRRSDTVRALAEAESKYADVPELVLICDDDVRRPAARLNERGGIRNGTVVLSSAQADKLEVPIGSRVLVADMPLPLSQPKGSRSSPPVSWWLWSVGGSGFQETSLPVTSLPAVGYYVRFRNREPEGFTSRELSLMLAGFGRFQADVWGVPLSGRVPKGWVPLTKDLVKGEFERARTSLGNVDRLTALEKAWDVSDFDKIVQFLVRDTSPDPDHAEALRRLHALKAEADTFGLDGNEIEAKLAFYDLPQTSAHVLAPEDDPKLLHERLLVAKPLLRLIDRRWIYEQEECDILSSYLKS